MTVSSSTDRGNGVGHFKRRPRLQPQPTRNPGFLLELPKGREGWPVARRIRVVRRALAVLAWTLPAMLIQAVLIMLPGRLKIAFPRFYWLVLIRLIGIKVRVIGNLASATAGRRVVFVSNHSSWVDIPVLGSVLDGCFVSKIDVAAWPIISMIARLGRTVYVSRSRISTGRERAAMRVQARAWRQPHSVSRRHQFRRVTRAAVQNVVLRPGGEQTGENVSRTCRLFSRFRWSMTGWAVCPLGGRAGRSLRGTAIWTSPRIFGD